MSNVTCIVPAWGTGAWGTSPWGGPAPGVGGPLPSAPPFDLFCFGDCTSISTFFTHPDVSPEGDTSQMGVNMDGSLFFGGGGGGVYHNTDARAHIDTPVPVAWTLEFTILPHHLPTNFGDLVNRHFFIGASDAQGVSAGLFFSEVGIIYTGAIHHTLTGDLVLDSATQQLPNSLVLISELDAYTYRIATDLTSMVTYIYATKTTDVPLFGHQLRWVMPAIPSSTCLVVPPDQVLISVRGTNSEEVLVTMNQICLGSGVLIPNLQPRADAGPDQSIVTCRIARLDGSKSFDPEGALLAYHWRLIDVPVGSQFGFDGGDGATLPFLTPIGFTDKFYSVRLGAAHAMDPFDPGDVLAVGGKLYDILSYETDGSGFFARIQGYVLPDNISPATNFKIIRQRGLGSRTSPKPTFYPDAPGLYKFDLVVFDGSLASDPALTILNVTESVVPRGCTPDARFIWNYLSDFWKLVEGKERIETFWSGLIQVVASELLNLWQIEYSKSLRDIQRTFQRKWLRYDLLMQEAPTRIEESSVRAIYAGIESSDIPSGGLSGLNGLMLEILLPSGITVRGTVSGGGTLTAAQIAAQFDAQFSNVTGDLTISVHTNTAGTQDRIRVDAAYVVVVTNSTTVPFFSPSTSSYPKGSGGGVNARTYKVDRSLLGIAIQEGDFLVLGGTAYRIARIISDPSDAFLGQRITTLDDIPVAGTPTTWAISGQATSKTLDFWNGMVSAGDRVTFEILRASDGQIAYVTSAVLGASESVTSTLAVDADALGYFIQQSDSYSVFLYKVLRRQYVPVDPLVVDIPFLQEKIRTVDDQEVLRRNVDFFIEEFRGAKTCRFTVGTPDVWQGVDPPIRMWAEITYLDNRPTIESNFGIPAEFTLDDLSQLPSNVDYLSAVRGLWYAYFNGPTLFNLRAGTQILLGLPFAEEAGTVEEIRSDFSTTSGRILIRDAANTEIVRAYTYPAVLGISANPDTNKPYAVGDHVDQFVPLVAGVEVLDYVKSPKWFEGYMNQGHFLEIEKFFKFLVRVDSAAFNLNALLFVRSFILKIKPRYTFPLFVIGVRVGGKAGSEVSVTDSLQMEGILHLYDGAYFRGGEGASTMFDEPSAARGGYRSQFDTEVDPIAPPPTSPDPTFPIVWGFDRDLLSPEDNIVAVCHATHAGGVPVDDAFFFDGAVLYTDLAVEADVHAITHLETGGQVFTAIYNRTSGAVVVTEAELHITGTAEDLSIGNNNYDVTISINAVPVHTFSIEIDNSTERFYQDFSGLTGITISPGDTISITIAPTLVGSHDPQFRKVNLFLGAATSWNTGNSLPAGSYYRYVPL